MREPRTWKGHQDKEGAPKTEVILATLMPGAGLCPMVGGGVLRQSPEAGWGAQRDMYQAQRHSGQFPLLMGPWPAGHCCPSQLLSGEQ